MTLAKSSPSFKSPHSNTPRDYEFTYGRINSVAKGLIERSPEDGQDTVRRGPAGADSIIAVRLASEPLRKHDLRQVRDGDISKLGMIWSFARPRASASDLEPSCSNLSKYALSASETVNGPCGDAGAFALLAISRARRWAWKKSRISLPSALSWSSAIPMVSTKYFSFPRYLRATHFPLEPFVVPLR